MQALTRGLRWLREKFAAFGCWLWSLAGPEPFFFLFGVLVLFAITFGMSKFWHMAVDDTGYYENMNGTPDFMIMRGNFVGYTVCWTKPDGSNTFEGCVETRKR